MYERLTQIDPSLAPFLPGAARAAQRASQPRPSAPYLDEEEEQSLVGSLRDKGVSFIGSVGNLLDVPGSMVRDVASSFVQGKFVNPFDQLLSPLSADNRTTGRDLARQAGMASSQDTWGNAFGGFGLEVGLDPLTYVTGGASALTKLGKGASKVGLLDDLGKVARTKGIDGKAVQAGVIGPRQARTTTSLQDFTTYGDEATKAKAQKLLQGVSPEDAAKPIGGLYNIGLPFMDPIATLGTGKTAQKYAKGMDSLMRTIRYGRPIAGMEAPVNSFLNLFDAPTGGAKTAFGAEQARERFRARQKLPTEVKMKVAERGMFLDKLVKNPNSHLARGLNDYLAQTLGPEEFGKLADDKVLKHRAISDAIRQGVEGVKPPEELPEAINWIVKSIREEVEALPDEMRMAGGRVKELIDDEIDYAARYSVEPSIRKTKPKDTSQVPKDPSMANQRLDFLKNIAGGTTRFAKEVAADPMVREIVATGKYKPEGSTKELLGPEGLAKYIEDKHGEWLSNTYTTWTDKGVRKEREGRYKKIGQMLYAMDADQLKAGVFGNHVLLDQQARMVSHMDAVNGLEKFTDALVEPGVLRSIKEWTDAGARVKAADDTTVPLLGLLKQMNLDFYKTHSKKMPTGDIEPIQGGIGPALAAKMGVDINDLKKMRVDKRIAADLANLNKAITGPEAVGDILNMVDSFTNFSKGMWTSIWPAFHVRNQVSGWIQNAMLGMWDPQSASAAVRMQQGKPVDVAMEIPAVREIWEQRLREAGKALPTPPASAPAVGPLGFIPPGNKSLDEAVQEAIDTGKIDTGASTDLNQFFPTVPLEQSVIPKGPYPDDKYISRLNRADAKPMPLADLIADDMQTVVSDDAVKHYQGIGDAEPIIIHETKIPGKYRIHEGRHRAVAAKLRGDETVPAYVFDKEMVDRLEKRRDVRPRNRTSTARPDITPDSKLTPEIATEILAEMLSGSSAIGGHDANRIRDVIGGVEATSGTLPKMLAGLPRPGEPSLDVGRAARKAAFIEPGTSFNPIASRGVGGRTDTTFGPGAAGEEIGNFVENNNRIQPMINLLKKGYSLDEAKAKVDAAQVSYANRSYTKFEQQFMARVLPFYKFSRSQLPFHARQILEKPGGATAQTLRAMNNAQDQGELAPEYVRQTASIPVESDSFLSMIFGAPPEGVDRYVAGLGLMNEDLFSLAPDTGSLMREFLGRSNPLIKGPLEFATNQSFFQSGPEGGRPLDDMDPLIGRLIANVTGQEDAVRLPKMLEQAAANSPIARLLTTLRTLTDKRKQSDYGGFMPERTPGPATLFNLLSGIRVTDVSPGSRDAIVRDLLNREMKDTGASVFERVSFTKEDLAKMSPEERENAIRLQALANVLARRSKERKREREKAEAEK